MKVLHGIIASMSKPFKKTFTVGKAMRGLAKVSARHARKVRWMSLVDFSDWLVGHLFFAFDSTLYFSLIKPNSLFFHQ
jgi:hypothetical protein